MDTNTYIPDAFIADVKQYIPAHLCLDDFVAACRTPLRRSVRVNTLKMSVAEFVTQANKKGWAITPVPWCSEGFWLERPTAEESALPLGNTDLHLSGAMYVQEASSMLPPLALADVLNDAEYVLDMAAAPGSKTSQLAALMGNRGVLIANEYSSSRLKVLSATMKRCGVANCALSHFDAAIFGDYMSESFDAILLDAPCSGEGTVRKDPDALKNWSVESNHEIAEVQKQLIRSAFYALKPGGTLVYSTCTLTPLENQLVCQVLLDEFAENVEIEPLGDLFDGAEKAMTDEGYLHVWPQLYDSEGFFIARFRKKASLASPVQKQKKGAFPFAPYGKKHADAFNAVLARQFGMSALPGTLMQRDNELWLFPEGFNAVSEKIKYSRIGIQLGQIHKNGVRLSHELATCFGHLALKNTHALTSEQAEDYFRGKDPRLEQASTQKGDVILTLCGAPVGFGKWQGHKIKNALPRDLVQNTRLITWE